MPMFIGDLNGARVYQVGIGTTDATVDGTEDVLFDGITHDLYPGQGGASVLFTQIDCTIRHTGGYNIGLTPIVDGRSDAEQTFQSASPAVGTDGTVTVKAYFRLRGERCACRIRQIAATDVVEIADVACEFVGLRNTSAS